VDQIANERIGKELAYYKRQVDALAGEVLRLDYTISGMRHALEQKRKGYELLGSLLESCSSDIELSSIFETTIREISSALGMDRTVVLTPAGEGYRPSFWVGFGEDCDAPFAALTVQFPPEFSSGGGHLRVTGASARTPLAGRLQEAFGLPFFICLPVMGLDAPLGILLAGRLKEAKPLYPPLDQGDVDTLQAIAGLISAFVRIRQVAVLEEKDRLKTAFFSNISHEFRTPITLTLGPLEGILAGRLGAVPEAVLEQVRMIIRNQERLLGLVNQILDLAKMEAGKMPLAAVRCPEVNRFVEERAGQFHWVAEKRGLALRICLDPRLEGADLYLDPDKFDKLAFNLLSNAFKFTRQGFVEVATERIGETFRFRVTDTGEGIRTDHLPYVFDRFYQASSTAPPEQAGTGLGLAWVKEIAKLHGGTVTVLSEYGAGSSFAVTVPLGKGHLSSASVVSSDEAPTLRPPPSFIAGEIGPDPESAERLNKESEAVFDPAKPTILYAEDNPDLRDYVRKLLAGEFNVFVAADGAGALDKIRKVQPDLVVTDQLMPVLSGRDLLRSIRGDELLRAIPVIFLTAQGGTEARIESLESGADDYLAKPFNESELLARIRNLLQARAQERKLAELNRLLEARIEAELAKTRLAASIQLGLLPKESPVIRGYEVAGRTIPAQLVGGDYFDFIPIDEKRWAICLGDVSGKGLPAALLMANLQATIRGQTLWSPSACDCMDRSNKLLFRSTDPSKFATLFYGVLNIQSNWLCYSNAGHNPPLLMSNGREPVPLTSGGIMLGLIENSSFEEEVVPLRPHDLLVIYSDGITDAENLQEEEFGEQRLVALLNQHRAASACDLVEKILAAVQFHSRGAEQTDDITLVVVKRNQARDS